jgi:hypothetical protein
MPTEVTASARPSGSSLAVVDHSGVGALSLHAVGHAKTLDPDLQVADLILDFAILFLSPPCRHFASASSAIMGSASDVP